MRVVSPASFRHFGIAYGDGIVNNLRHAPWKAALLPLFLLSFALAARRASRDADMVHAHWLPSALPALATGKPFVLQLWGSDVALARHAPLALAPPRPAGAGRRLRLAVARRRRTRARRAGRPGDPEPRGDPRVGRRAGRPAARALRRAALRGERRARARGGGARPAARRRRRRATPPLFPDAVGFVPPHELGPYYERAALVVVPSRREGYGMVAREAMAHGRPSSRPQSAGSSMPSRTASRGCSCRPATAVPSARR